jgi:hypothetical protein
MTLGKNLPSIYARCSRVLARSTKDENETGRAHCRKIQDETPEAQC